MGYFHGMIDEVRIYNTTLSTIDIEQWTGKKKVNDPVTPTDPTDPTDPEATNDNSCDTSDEISNVPIITDGSEFVILVILAFIPIIVLGMSMRLKNRKKTKQRNIYTFNSDLNH